MAVVLVLAGITVSCRPDADPRRHRVQMRTVAFDPVVLEVAPGDTITWVNDDIVPHTVTAVDGRWDSGEIPPGAEFRVTAAGDALEYVCRYHPVMTGTFRAR